MCTHSAICGDLGYALGHTTRPTHSHWQPNTSLPSDELLTVEASCPRLRRRCRRPGNNMAPSRTQREDTDLRDLEARTAASASSHDLQKTTLTDHKRHVPVFKLRKRTPVEKQGPKVHAELRRETSTSTKELDPETLLIENGVSTLPEFLTQKLNDAKVMTLGDELWTFL